MQYRVNKPVYIEGKEYQIGELVEVSDQEFAQKLVSKGTLGDANVPNGFPQTTAQGGGNEAAPLGQNQNQDQQPSTSSEPQREPEAGSVQPSPTPDKTSIEQQIENDLQNLGN